MVEYAGWPINWDMGTGRFGIKMHPLYIKYNAQRFGEINLNDVKADLDNCLATSEGSVIVAYLAWLIRCKNLSA